MGTGLAPEQIWVSASAPLKTLAGRRSGRAMKPGARAYKAFSRSRFRRYVSGRYGSDAHTRVLSGGVSTWTDGEHGFGTLGGFFLQTFAATTAFKLWGSSNAHVWRGAVGAEICQPAKEHSYNVFRPCKFPLGKLYLRIANNYDDTAIAKVDHGSRWRTQCRMRYCDPNNLGVCTLHPYHGASALVAPLAALPVYKTGARSGTTLGLLHAAVGGINNKDYIIQGMFTHVAFAAIRPV